MCVGAQLGGMTIRASSAELLVVEMIHRSFITLTAIHSTTNSTISSHCVGHATHRRGHQSGRTGLLS